MPRLRHKEIIMKIRELLLYTKNLAAEKDFYKNTLGFEIYQDMQNSFSVNIGASKLKFQESKKQYLYHYCFLIPRNKLQTAIKWLQERLEPIEIEEARVSQFFSSWNAESVYFYDASGNIAEFIVRYDLANDSDTEFGIESIININEIGLASSKPEDLNQQLEQEIGSKFWKGDKKRFGTNGSQEGLFLLPNYELKEIWFPTTVKITASPFEVVIEHEAKQYLLVYQNSELKISVI